MSIKTRKVKARKARRYLILPTLVKWEPGNQVVSGSGQMKGDQV